MTVRGAFERVKRMISLLLVLTLVCGIPATVKGEDTDVVTHESDTHFVPENPDVMPLAEEDILLDLSKRKPGTIQECGMDAEDGSVVYAGGVTNGSMFEIPFTLQKGETVSVTVTGRFNTAEDKGVRFYLSNAYAENCNMGMLKTIANNGEGVFTETFDLKASAPADHLMLSGNTFAARLHDFTLLSISVHSDAAMDGSRLHSVSYADSVGTEWYRSLLEASHMRLGNNKRLHALVERARAGEKITIATIGGSITEGAGATRYKECYAYQIYDGFRKQYGAGDGANVAFVNAGVGGTPSTFGIMRYQSDVVDRVQDDDGLPDMVVIEFSVNDYGEPTKHRAFESMVKQILMQPNEPVVVILFAVFRNGFNLQEELRAIGDAYDVMMVSVRDGAYPYVGNQWTSEAFFYDEYHPTTLGHKVMADCVLSTIEAALEEPVCETDHNLDAAPAYATDFMGLQSILKGRVPSGVELTAGGFGMDDTASYQNLPVGRVCGENFHHTAASGDEPLTMTAVFKNLMIAYRATGDADFGDAEVFVDGKKVAMLKGNTGSWGQSVVDLVWDQAEAAEHTVEIKMAAGSEKKKFTVTCIACTPD